MTTASPTLPAPLYAIALTRAGANVARSLAGALPDTTAFVASKHGKTTDTATAFDEPVAKLIERLWPEAGGFLLVMASGIAVRSIAPLLEDKSRDPAVLVFDPNGQFAVPILSGHLGGANALAEAVSEKLGMTAVITTATDVAGRPAAEVWARDAGFAVENKEGVVRVNAAWADDDPVGLYLDPAISTLEELSAVVDLRGHLAMATSDEQWAARFSGALIVVSYRILPVMAHALFLRPPVLSLGVGCRLAADPETVEQGVRGALADAGLSSLAVATVSSVDAKKEEPALIRLAESLGVPYRTFPAEILKNMETPTPSKRVEQAVGTPSVSEAAALVAAGAVNADALLLPKQAGTNWTLSVALLIGRDAAE